MKRYNVGLYKDDMLLCFLQGLKQLHFDELTTIGIITAAAVVLVVIIGVSILVYKRLLNFSSKLKDKSFLSFFRPFIINRYMFSI